MTAAACRLQGGVPADTAAKLALWSRHVSAQTERKQASRLGRPGQGNMRFSNWQMWQSTMTEPAAHGAQSDIGAGGGCS